MNRIRLDDLTSDELDQLYDALDALRAVARGYCPACGRGDAAPTVTDWEQQKQRADQADQLANHLAGLLADIYRIDATSIVNEARDAIAAAHTALQEQP